MKSAFIFMAFLWCALPRPVIAQDEDSLRVGVKGFVDTYHAVRTEQPNDWMSSRTRVRGEVSVEKGHAGAFVTANLVYNAILKERTGFQLRPMLITQISTGICVLVDRLLSGVWPMVCV